MSRHVAATLPAVAALVAVSPVSAMASTRLTPVRIAPAAGWQVRYGGVKPCPGVSRARCSQVVSVASTLRFFDCLDCLPHRTAARMRPGDVVIQINLAVERPLRLRPRPWPPRIASDRVGSFDGLPQRIGTYQASGRVGPREFSVFVLFGRAHPTRRQLERASAELRRARAPARRVVRRSGQDYTRSDSTRSSQLSASWNRVGLFSGV